MKILRKSSNIASAYLRYVKFSTDRDLLQQSSLEKRVNWGGIRERGDNPD
mgnify:CR=1 FL=1